MDFASSSNALPDQACLSCLSSRDVFLQIDLLAGTCSVLEFLCFYMRFARTRAWHLGRLLVSADIRSCTHRNA
jgi:hypothetical protein